jgi:hypothetical protein
VAQRVEEVVGHDAHGILDTAGREHLCHKEKRLDQVRLMTSGVRLASTDRQTLYSMPVGFMVV